MEEILITPIKSEQISEEGGETLFCLQARLDVYLTTQLQSLFPKWDIYSLEWSMIINIASLALLH